MVGRLPVSYTWEETMVVQEMFHILQIEETKDKNEIKTAYRRLLQQTNPEDDPEGFKQLRYFGKRKQRK